MEKDFDRWNHSKKQIDKVTQRRYYRARDIWWCSLGVNIGFEQNGKGDDLQRPVLIIKGFSREVCLAVPLTTSIKNNLYHVPLGRIGDKNSFAIISQLRLIDTKRLTSKIAVLDKDIFEAVRKTIKSMI